MPEFSKPEPFDFDAAGEMVQSCLRSVVNFHLQVLTSWTAVEHRDGSFDEFQSRTADNFGRLARLYARATAVVSAELLAAIATANAAQGNLPTVDSATSTHHHIGFRPCVTFHEAILEAARDILGIPARQDVPDLIIDFPTEMLRGEYETEAMGDRLQRGLARLRKDEWPGAAEYWGKVAKEILDYPIVASPLILQARLGQEIAIAKSSFDGDEVSSEDSTETAGPWSKARTRGDWATAYGVSPTTFDRMRKPDRPDYVRSQKQGRKIQIYVADLPSGYTR